MHDLTLDLAVANPLVLIADDDKNTRELLGTMLQREGFRVESAADGQEAVKKAFKVIPDLILLDIQMPGLDGFEVLGKLRAEPTTEHIPIIVISAAARDSHDVVKGLGLGADDYLLKPFAAPELIARVYSKMKARQLEDSLLKRTQELEALVRVGRELNQGLTLEDLGDRLLGVAMEQFNATKAVLTLFNGQERIMERRRGLEKVKTDLLTTDTLGSLTFSDKEPLLVSDISEDKRVSAILNGTNCKSGIAAPLMHQNEIHGVLVLGHEQPNHFSNHDLRVLRSIAEQSALAIRNAQLYQQLHEYAQGLESMVETRTQALQSAQTQLMRADKLAALGTLAAGVAHEVNNPLQPILSSLELALEDLDSGRQVERELLEYAMRDVVRIKKIVSSLLDFARPATSTLAPTDVNTLVSDVLSLAGKQLQVTGIKIKTSYAPMRKIIASGDQLKQVFLNLMVNAMDAMKGGGELTITTYEQEGYATVELQDTGTGIPQETLEKIFDPFFTTKPSGTGLGLSVSHSIIEGHGGLIAVESELNRGTRFTVKLPVIADSAAQ
ncbi:MAG: response regulator [Anaerolineae bacterium]